MVPCTDGFLGFEEPVPDVWEAVCLVGLAGGGLGSTHEFMLYLTYSTSDRMRPRCPNFVFDASMVIEYFCKSV